MNKIAILTDSVRKRLGDRLNKLQLHSDLYELAQVPLIEDFVLRGILGCLVARLGGQQTVYFLQPAPDIPCSRLLKMTTDKRGDHGADWLCAGIDGGTGHCLADGRTAQGGVRQDLRGHRFYPQACGFAGNGRKRPPGLSIASFPRPRGQHEAERLHAKELKQEHEAEI